MDDRYIYSTFDAGEVAIFDDNVYVRQGWTQAKPNKSWKTTNIIDVKGLEFTRDDNNVVNGNLHRLWSKIEMAISDLSIHTSCVWTSPTFLSNSPLTPVWSNKHLLDLNLTYTCQADGIARVIIASNTADVDVTRYILINGVNVPFYLKANASLNDANAYKVLAGDEISIPNAYSRVIVLPYEYSI